MGLTLECLDLTAMLIPTVNSRPPTTLLMDLDSVSRPPTCQLPLLSQRLYPWRPQSTQELLQPQLLTPQRLLLPRLSSKLSLMRSPAVARGPPQLPPLHCLLQLHSTLVPTLVPMPQDLLHTTWPQLAHSLTPEPQLPQLPQPPLFPQQEPVRPSSPRSN